MASALTSTTINRDPVTYTEAVESPQQDTEGRLEEECTSILLNNTSAVNSGKHGNCKSS